MKTIRYDVLAAATTILGYDAKFSAGIDYTTGEEILFLTSVDGRTIKIYAKSKVIETRRIATYDSDGNYDRYHIYWRAIMNRSFSPDEFIEAVTKFNDDVVTPNESGE